jgi:hypothetical protein
MAYTANKLKAQALRRLVDFDPDSADPVAATLDPLTGAKGFALATHRFRSILVALQRTVGTGNTDAFAVVTADDAAMSANVTVIASHAAPTGQNAVGDTLVFEVTGEQIQAAKAATNLYVGVRVELATSTDEGVVYFEGHGHAGDGLTVDYIS